MKIAFVSQDGIRIDQHFGRADFFYVYEILPSGEIKQEKRHISNVSAGSQPSTREEEVDRIDNRIRTIEDCTILYCSEIGPTAAARVVRHAIHPIKNITQGLITDELIRITKILNDPPIWLRKVSERKKQMAREGTSV